MGLCHHDVNTDEIDCEECAEENTCRHGTRTDQIECEECADEEEIGDGLDSELETYCEHDILEDECHECQAKFDNLADKHREQQDWNHFHSED